MAFINIYNTLSEALSSYESPITSHYSFDGIQLLPAQTNPYTQFSENSTGVELEDWEVYAVNIRNSERTNITDKFFVFGNFTDTNGMPQIIWTLTDLPDLGWDFVYLEINQLLGATYYTNIFRVTNHKKEFTTRFDYKAKTTDYYQSIQLNVWYKQDLNRDEITTYYEISTKNTVSVAIKEASIQKWYTNIVNNALMLKLRDLLNTRYKYIDLVRFDLFEAFEIPEISQRQNFAQQSFLISLQKNDLLIENINEMSILTDIEFLKAVLKPVTDGGVIWIFGRPAIEIPAGYEEETNLAGKTIIGRLDGDASFGTLGATGGSKTFTLTEANLPAHTHRMFVNSAVDISENRLSDFPDRNVTYRGTGEGSADHDYTMASSVTDATLGKTSSIGSGTSVTKLDPYRVVNFIKWVGLP
jgi:hypothetical protein